MLTAIGIAFGLLSATVPVVADRPVSGLRPGDEVAAWEPVHIAGPHTGTKTCPVCTYLDAPVLLAFAADLAAAESLTTELERLAAAHRSGKLKVMLVVVRGSDDDLQALAKRARVQHLMLCRPDSMRAEKQLKAYKIAPQAMNTIMLYQNYLVKQTWVNLSKNGLAEVKRATDEYLSTR